MGSIKNIIYNCKRATFLIEKKLIDRLTLREKIELRIHLCGCSICRMFYKQSAIINKMVQQLFRSSNDAHVHLDDAFKQELQHRIEEELNKN
jgi:predicted anti-sigma-YlaC factor YlaD